MAAPRFKIETLPIGDFRVRHAWKYIENSFHGLSPFMRYDFQMVLACDLGIKRFAGYTASALCAVDVRGEIKAILPVVTRRTDGSVRLLGDIKGCGINDMLLSPDLGNAEKDEIAQAIVMTFLSLARGNRWKLRRLPTDSLLRSIDTGSVETVTDCAAIDISCGDALWLKGLSKSVRQNLRTAYNRLSRNGDDITLEKYVPGDDPEIYRRALSLYCRRQAEAYTDGNLLTRAAHRLKLLHSRQSKALGTLPFALTLLLKIREKPAACMTGILSADGKTYAVPRLAIEPEFSFFSPGYILLSEAVRYFAMSGGPKVIDLSRGREKYKTDLGGSPYLTYDLRPARM